ncbi:MAG: hypothetical protein HY914_22945 [Desulfomonile tiedjei]|nr:hypothetical protein [Desulfomonile tiedjei]
MVTKYQQFLGTRPGLLVELTDDSSSPFRVRAEDGFEFFVSAEDFRNYYREEGEPTPAKWKHMITEPETGMIDADKMGEVMTIINHFLEWFQDFDRARAFVREALRVIGEQPRESKGALQAWLEQSGWNPGKIMEKDLAPLLDISDEVKALLLNESCAVIQLAYPSNAPGNGTLSLEQAAFQPSEAGQGGAVPPLNASTPQRRRGGMKNVDMAVEGDTLTLVIDLSKDFGPSKSGKTIIVASTEGNKSVPGREEKVGLNIYRQEGKKTGKGRKSSFNNVEMDLHGDELKITVDLSKEKGPSKSGKTVIIGSTEGNQLVFGREEKIGLNVYKKLE